MSTIIDIDTSELGDFDVEIPQGWEVVPPPAGISLLALEPEDAVDPLAFRSNLVVTVQPRTESAAPTSAMVDDYLETLLDTLDQQLTDVEELGVWVSDEHPERPERLATQRILIAYRIDTDDRDAPLEVEMLQQHVWLADEIVTLTATVPAGVDDAMIDTLNVCLESLTIVR